MLVLAIVQTAFGKSDCKIVRQSSIFKVVHFTKQTDRPSFSVLITLAKENIGIDAVFLVWTNLGTRVNLFSYNF